MRLRASDVLVALLTLSVAALCGGALLRYRRAQRSLVPWAEADTHFIQRGLQYYVAGRFSALSHQFPICANLLHHSVEMLLKGSLCRSHSKGQLRAMGHNLRGAWLAFKALHPDPRLDQFDATVKALNKFERIRYPDDVLNKGMIGTFDLFHEHKSTFKSYWANTPPHYSLNLEDVDQLVVLFFEVAKFNPHFFLNSISVSAREILNDRNRHPFPAA
jgi:hypothetical protein